MSNYAMIKNKENMVFNTIVADESFSMDGYYFIKIEDGVFCQPGMFYNKADKTFYMDKDFTELPS